METIWAEPRNIRSLDDCYFYHTMDIPDFGLVQGQWDLRGRESSYLGNVRFHGKRVLEVGTASGHLCFTMEKMGADVTAFDLSGAHEWDIVPYAGSDYAGHMPRRKKHIDLLNNGFWLAHGAFKSRAKVLYGTLYDIPGNIGEFDICTFGSVLLHVRDPFLALQKVTAHVTETAIVTDVLPRKNGIIISAAERLTGTRLNAFLPNTRNNILFDTWWTLSPDLVAEFLRILGFSTIEISFHRQKYAQKEVRLYTVVGHRQPAVID